MMKIGVDAMGGDFAPLESVKGAVTAARVHPEFKVVLFGDKSAIENVCIQENLDQTLFEIIHCPTQIEMGEHPVRAFTTKHDSSIAVGLHYLAEGKVDAFLSAGNTGAMLVGSLMTVKAIPGIDRPCLTSVVPRLNNHPGLLLDVGANADCKPEHLQQFSILGSVFYGAVNKVDSPKVGLLNIGEEEEKGSLFTRATHSLLKSTGGINFVGNVEGRDIFGDHCDVIVCDGFTGNVIIKVCEGMYYRLAKRGVQDDYLDKFNFKHYGGSSILGVNAPVIVGHGISKADTFVKMIELAAEEVSSGMIQKIKDAVATYINPQATA
jgi:glycerol-3-phosphate acyltransferase PlsX